MCQYNQELCISLITRCFTNRLQSRPLNWNSVVAQTIQNAAMRLNILRSTCGTWWGADPITLLILYKGIISSHLDFAFQILLSKGVSLLGKLDKI